MPRLSSQKIQEQLNKVEGLYWLKTFKVWKRYPLEHYKEAFQEHESNFIFGRAMWYKFMYI